MRLRSVLDHRQTVALRNGHDAVHLCGHPKQVHWDNRFGAGRDRRFELVGVHGPAFRMDIHKDWLGTDVADGPGSGYETHRNCDDLVSWADIQASQRQVQGARATIKAHTMISSAILREFRLEICSCRSLSESARFANLFQ